MRKFIEWLLGAGAKPRTDAELIAMQALIETRIAQAAAKLQQDNERDHKRLAAEARKPWKWIAGVSLLFGVCGILWNVLSFFFSYRDVDQLVKLEVTRQVASRMAEPEIRKATEEATKGIIAKQLKPLEEDADFLS